MAFKKNDKLVNGFLLRLLLARCMEFGEHQIVGKPLSAFASLSLSLAVFRDLLSAGGFIGARVTR